MMRSMGPRRASSTCTCTGAPFSPASFSAFLPQPAARMQLMAHTRTLRILIRSPLLVSEDWRVPPDTARARRHMHCVPESLYSVHRLLREPSPHPPGTEES